MTCNVMEHNMHLKTTESCLRRTRDDGRVLFCKVRDAWSEAPVILSVETNLAPLQRVRRGVLFMQILCKSLLNKALHHQLSPSNNAAASGWDLVPAICKRWPSNWTLLLFYFGKLANQQIKPPGGAIRQPFQINIIFLSGLNSVQLQVIQSHTSCPAGFS